MINTTSFLLSIIIPSYNMEEYIGNNIKMKSFTMQHTTPLKGEVYETCANTQVKTNLKIDDPRKKIYLLL